jgi:hypothetical protein
VSLSITCRLRFNPNDDAILRTKRASIGTQEQALYTPTSQRCIHRRPSVVYTDVPALYTQAPQRCIHRRPSVVYTGDPTLYTQAPQRCIHRAGKQGRCTQRPYNRRWQWRRFLAGAGLQPVPSPFAVRHGLQALQARASADKIRKQRRHTDTNICRPPLQTLADHLCKRLQTTPASVSRPPLQAHSVGDTRRRLSRKPHLVVIARAQPEAIQLLSVFSGLLHFVTNDGQGFRYSHSSDAPLSGRTHRCAPTRDSARASMFSIFRTDCHTYYMHNYVIILR